MDIVKSKLPPLLDPRRAKLRGLFHRVWIQAVKLLGVIEHLPTFIVHKTFRQRTFRPNDRVLVELNMKVGHVCEALFLANARAVHEGTRRDQHAIDIHPMLGRDPQIAPWSSRRKRVRANEHRLNVAILRNQCTGMTPAADPANRAQIA